ncbi:MAG TPA: creatininase family protein, partial [Candidatus Krumholzibacteria bacterium]|nr:creatininase family protein [Candidatus Krumholzibacteria bacterium]
MNASALLLGLFLAANSADSPSTRDLSDINWMELKELVPSKVNTVILPTGTLEPHGVINNGADITAPVAIAKQIAPGVNAMVAPIVPYGMTGAMDAYAGSFSITEAAYRAYLHDVLAGLAKNGFKNIIVVNGHGGPQTAVLNAVAADVGREAHVRTLVINWWSYCSDVTLEVFKQDGGHAGWNETAFVQAVDPKLV